MTVSGRLMAQLRAEPSACFRGVAPLFFQLWLWGLAPRRHPEKNIVFQTWSAPDHYTYLLPSACYLFPQRPIQILEISSNFEKIKILKTFIF
jgi:hypothetical protein